MVTATVRFVVPASKRAEALQVLRSLRGPTEAYPDCRRCCLYACANDDNRLLLLQEWTTQAALDRYLRSDVYRTILAIMETASEPPEIRFDTLAQRAGVEVVEAARG
jgi:quinol monooxygenase YgiN